jgi:Domain of unknown function (DUF4136)
MRVPIVSILLLALLGIQAAPAQKIRYDFDKDRTFSDYKTYKWVSIKGGNALDDITAKEIVAAVDAQLLRKGLTKTDSDTADLLIAYQTTVGTEKQWTSYSTYWGFGPAWGAGWSGYGFDGMGTGTTYGSTSTIYVGQLDLSMHDSAHNELVWRGIASETLDLEAKPEKKEKNINKAVEKLLRNYPPKQKK